jgi:hypothetical protein
MKWKRTLLETVRRYEIDEGSVPDLQDSRQTRRYVVRPMRVKLYQVYESNLVRGAVIEGRQVRRDGQFNKRSNAMICVGRTRFYDAEPPAWLDRLLADEGLTWAVERKEAER